jgi:hypothetical protein
MLICMEKEMNEEMQEFISTVYYTSVHTRAKHGLEISLTDFYIFKKY